MLTGFRHRNYYTPSWTNSQKKKIVHLCSWVTRPQRIDKKTDSLTLQNRITDKKYEHNRPKSLLSCRIPNLQFDNFTADINKLATKLNTNSVCGILLNYTHTTPFIRNSNTISVLTTKCAIWLDYYYQCKQNLACETVNHAPALDIFLFFSQ